MSTAAKTMPREASRISVDRAMVARRRARASASLPPPIPSMARSCRGPTTKEWAAVSARATPSSDILVRKIQK